MTAEQRRLWRLYRLEKVRALARHSAAAEAARAEGTLAQLEALAARTRTLADDYRARADPGSGLELRQLAGFAAGLRTISASTTHEAQQARVLADLRQHELAQAERSRAAAEDRANAWRRVLDQRAQRPVLAARRKIGTGFE